VMRRAGGRPHGLRIRALVTVLWRAGLRIAEALALHESDLEPRGARFWFEVAKVGGVA
jgi:site-specific recombinase XerD